MAGLAAAMDVAALIFLGWCAAVLRRNRDEPDGDAGQSAALALIAVSLVLLSIPLWALP
ncbi:MULTISPECIES: hypothetical protein [Actinomadura]|uniref:hypothetical protein n=1 Tax=Actinomadura TaxID=1988 RepID=UPI000423B0C8|nr:MULTISPECIES: hypothetical protein [Actinomadura]